jgi:thiamine transport system ATP-binding protein
MLDVREVSVAFGERPVLDHVSLSVASGEVVALLGPSGSGKSTLLRVVCGLETPSSGSVWWDGTDVTRWPAHERRFGLVFQDNQLFPHRSVAANVEFGMRMRGIAKDERRRRVTELLDLVGLRGFEERSVTTLSGGEAKRVALARSLAPAPRLLLLDEPLTGLDTELHDRLLMDLVGLLRDTAMTAIVVTHDAREAEGLTGRVVQLRDLSR